MSARRVLVTGATSGIGAGIAQAFAALGDEVTATGATEAEVEAARGTPGIDLRGWTCATGRRSARSWRTGPNRFRGQLRRHDPRRDELDPVSYARVMAINLKGTMRVCVAAEPKLRRRRRSSSTRLRCTRISARPGPRLHRQQERRRRADGARSPGRPTASASMRWRPAGSRRRDDAGAAGRSGPRGAGPRAHADGPLGRAGGGGRAGAVPVLARRRASSPASCCRSTAAIRSADRRTEKWRTEQDERPAPSACSPRSWRRRCPTTSASGCRRPPTCGSGRC